MQLTYSNKKGTDEILKRTKKASLKSCTGTPCASKLIFGDNLHVMKSLLVDYGMRGKIDLVYIDPPFATNTKFKVDSERTSTISMSGKQIAYTDKLLGADYLEFLRERLVLLRELMSDKASIYLHIDYKIGHYVKIVLDEIFGIENFRNDITRIKCNPKNFSRKAYGNIKDLVLFYSKTSHPVWNNPTETMHAEDIARLFRKIDKNGRRYTTIPLHAPGETVNGKTGKPWRGVLPPKGRHWRSDPAIFDELDKAGLLEWSKNGVPRKIIYADEKSGKKIQDIWEYKDPQYPSYPTEKNLDMLKAIISASSNKGATVLDCFCGGGTTLVAAQELGRKWIGIDKSSHAIQVAKKQIEAIPANLYETSEYEYLEEVSP